MSRAEPATARTCAACPKAIGRRNRSGYCSTHIGRSPERREKISAGMTAAYLRDPSLREARREGGRIGAAKPGERERRAAHVKSLRLWELGLAGRTPESLAKIGRAVSERRMAWCPPHLRDEARWLVKSKHLKLEEVQRIILAQDAADIDRVRIRMGVQPVQKSDIAPYPIRVVRRAAHLRRITVDDLLSHSRKHHICFARFAAVAALRQNGMSFAQIGRAMGGKDHTTMIYAVKRAEGMAGEDPEFADLVRRLVAA